MKRAAKLAAAGVVGLTPVFLVTLDFSRWPPSPEWFLLGTLLCGVSGIVTGNALFIIWNKWL